MDNFVTGATIKSLREKLKMTQAELAAKLMVSDKAVSKWERGHGLPDIALLEPLAVALGVSVPELLCGRAIVNANRASNLLRGRLYACPVCGNAAFAKGEAMLSCCGIQLPPLSPEAPDDGHAISVERSEGELRVSVAHPMEKDHFITFIAYVTMDRFEMKVLYPEGDAEARFFIRGGGRIYCHCNRHGLFGVKV